MKIVRIKTSTGTLGTIHPTTNKHLGKINRKIANDITLEAIMIREMIKGLIESVRF